MVRPGSLILLALTAAGCSGRYILTVPEQVAPAGGEATIVARLQRLDFLNYAAPVADMPVRFRVEAGPQRGAFTDGAGYAAAAVSAPARPGRYHAVVELTDRNGREAWAFAPVYVWDPKAPAAAVEMDCLTARAALGTRPAGLTGAGASDARAALVKLARGGLNIVYLTRRSVSEVPRLRADLEAGGFPDGPVLQWQRQDWRVLGEGAGRRIAVQPRLVSPLPVLGRMLPGLTAGVCSSDLAANAFAEAKLRCVVIGGGAVGVPNPTRRPSWKEIEAKGL